MVFQHFISLQFHTFCFLLRWVSQWELHAHYRSLLQLQVDKVARYGVVVAFAWLQKCFILPQRGVRGGRFSEYHSCIIQYLCLLMVSLRRCMRPSCNTLICDCWIIETGVHRPRKTPSLMSLQSFGWVWCDPPPPLTVEDPCHFIFSDRHILILVFNAWW